MKPKVLVTKHIYQEAIDYLGERVDLEYHDSSDGFSPQDLIARLADKDGAVTQLTDKLGADVMEALPKLRVISNVAVGYDNIDVTAASQRKIVVTNTPEVLTDTTADFAFTLLMAAARRLNASERFLRAGKWTQWQIDLFCGQDIHRGTLGVVGIGRIGRAMARRGNGFDMSVLYHDEYRLPPEREQQLNITYKPFEDLLAEADFVSLHVPLLPATKHLIGAEQLAMMKKTAILINTSRGPVVDEAALADALEQGVIAGAGLDVFEHEPAVLPKLIELENAVLAPHIASASIATRTKMCLMAAENMVVALEGKRPPHLVNADLFDIQVG